MIIFESIKLAFKAVWTHKIRSFLTMLGILIGISSVVLLVSLGEGVKEDVKKMVSDLGSNFIFVIGGDIGIDTQSQSQEQNQGGIKTAFGNPANLISSDIFQPEDIDELKKIDGIEKVAPMGIIAGLVKYDDKLTSPLLWSTTPDMQYIMSGLKIDKGKFIEQSDIDEKKQVIIIGDIPRQNLFGDVDPIGKKLKIISQKNEYEFEVIGTFAKPTTSSLSSADFDTLAVIPYSTAKEKFNKDEDNIMRIGIKAYDNADIKEVANKIKENMLKRHEEAEFTVMTQEDMLGMLSDILGILTTFISAIAAISLVVGGVGIMNIMLVSVTERTREIGLRKAVGATNGAILSQFLIEAIIISTLGGLISLGLVKIGIEIIKHYSDLNPIITIESIILSMSVCIGIGLIFGLAPAMQAAKKDPIDALHYE